MKKIFFLAILFSFLFVPLANAKLTNIQDIPVAGIEKDMMPGEIRRIPPLPPKQNTLPNFLGQVQNYSVILRGNGEAIVTGKITFANDTDREMNLYEILSPAYRTVENFTAYQQIRLGICENYITRTKIELPYDQCAQYKTVQECDNSKTWNSGCGYYYCLDRCAAAPLPYDINDVCPQTICDGYEVPDYFSDNYYAGNEYHKLDVRHDHNLISLNLYKTIPPNGSGSIIFYYTQSQTARKNLFGAYDFTFETLKAEDRIRSLSVGISTDPDYFLKYAKGKIGYRTQETFSAIASKNLDLRTGAASPQMDSYYSQIGYGQITKTATNLQANESYKIKGSYADAQWKLYAGETIRNIFLFILAAVVFIAAIRLVIKNIFRGLPGITVASGKKSSSSQNTHPLILSVCLSFASSIIILVSILIFIFLHRFPIIYGFSNSYYYSSDLLQPLLVIIITVIILCIDILALFLPSLFMWKKSGSNWGILTFIFNIAWFLLYLMISFLIVFLFSFRNVQQINPIGPPMDTMKNF